MPGPAARHRGPASTPRVLPGRGTGRPGSALVFGGGLYSREQVSVVATDGTVTDGPHPVSKAYVGGFAVVDVPSREEGLE